VKDCGLPVAARKSALPATCPVKVHVTGFTNDTVRPSGPTVQTSGVLEVTDVVPSLLVLTEATKVPPPCGWAGTLVMVGGVGVNRPTEKGSHEPAGEAV